MGGTARAACHPLSVCHVARGGSDLCSAAALNGVPRLSLGPESTARTVAQNTNAADPALSGLHSGQTPGAHRPQSQRWLRRVARGWCGRARGQEGFLEAHYGTHSGPAGRGKALGLCVHWSVGYGERVDRATDRLPGAWPRRTGRGRVSVRRAADSGGRARSPGGAQGCGASGQRTRLWCERVRQAPRMGLRVPLWPHPSLKQVYFVLSSRPIQSNVASE